jgi:hypothetical protein
MRYMEKIYSLRETDKERDDAPAVIARPKAEAIHRLCDREAEGRGGKQSMDRHAPSGLAMTGWIASGAPPPRDDVAAASR